MSVYTKVINAALKFIGINFHCPWSWGKKAKRYYKVTKSDNTVYGCLSLFKQLNAFDSTEIVKLGEKLRSSKYQCLVKCRQTLGWSASSFLESPLSIVAYSVNQWVTLLAPIWLAFLNLNLGSGHFVSGTHQIDFLFILQVFKFYPDSVLWVPDQSNTTWCPDRLHQYKFPWNFNFSWSASVQQKPQLQQKWWTNVRFQFMIQMNVV